MTFDDLTINRPAARYHRTVCQLEFAFYDALTSSFDNTTSLSNAQEWDIVGAYLGCPMVDRII